MTEGTRRYAAYGLTIEANQPLAGARASAAATADVTIEFRTEPSGSTGPVHAAGADGSGWYAVDALDGGGRRYRLGADGGAREWSMEVSGDGARMTVRRTPRSDVADVTAFVMTRGLGACLAAMGQPVLHGCALDPGDGAVVVAGPSGAGKSTIAATAVRLGWELLTDDIAVLGVREARVHVERGLPRMRLDAPTARAAGWNPVDLQRVFVDPRLPDKRWVALEEGEEPTKDDARPLEAVYVLGARRAGPALLERVPPARALPLLLAHGYAADLLARDRRAGLLPFWARLAQDVPVTHVHAADDLAGLPALLDGLREATAARAV